MIELMLYSLQLEVGSMSKSEYSRLHAEWARSRRELENTLKTGSQNEIAFDAAEVSAPQNKSLFSTVWDLGSSFITGSIMLLILFTAIAFIFG